MPANRASANILAFHEAILARDVDAVSALVADDVVVIHHPSGLTYGKEEGRERFRLLFRTEDLQVSYDLVATLGDFCVLTRDYTSFSGYVDEELAFGAAQSSYINVGRVNSALQMERMEIFAENRRGDAVIRLYELHADALCAGPARDRAAARARAVALLHTSVGAEATASALAPTVEIVDHRSAGFGSMRGVEAGWRAVATAFEVAEDLVERCTRVLALSEDVLLTGWTTSGRERVGGGTFEWPHLRLCVLGEDGLVTRFEAFDDDDEAAALERFDALAGIAPTAGLPSCLVNVAVRANARFERAWNARDWGALVAAILPTFQLDDRRAVVGVPLSGRDFFANLRLMFDLPGSAWRNRILATRGERLALLHSRLTAGADADGRVEFQHLALVDVDRSERYRGIIVFDTDQLEAAYAELDAGFAAGEGAPHATLLAHWQAFRCAANARDWETARNLLPADFTMFSHRRLASSGERLDRDRFIAALGWNDYPGVRIVRRDHLPRLSATAAVEIDTFYGNVDGGDFEQDFILVAGHDGQRLRSFEAFDLDQLDEAFALFDQLSTGSPHSLRPSSAESRRAELTRAFTRAFAARHWDALAELLAPDLVVNDHRLLGWEPLHGPAAYIRALKQLVELAPDTGLRIDHVTMSGWRFLYVTTWIGSRDGGAFETPSVIVCQLDGTGRICRFDQYDIDRLDEVRRRFEAEGNRVPVNAASAAADRIQAPFDARDWSAMRALPQPDAAVLAPLLEFMDAWNAHDVGRMRRVLAPGVVKDDHRPAIRSRTEGIDALLADLGQIWKLAPDSQIDMSAAIVLACEAHGAVTYGRDVGTFLGGGAFERPRYVVFTAEHGRITRLEFFETNDADAALARLAELRP